MVKKKVEDHFYLKGEKNTSNMRRFKSKSAVGDNFLHNHFNPPAFYCRTLKIKTIHNDING